MVEYNKLNRKCSIVTGIETDNKQQVTIACFCTWHNASIPLENRRTVNSEWYITNCLPTSSMLWEKTTKNVASSCITTMLAPKKQVKQLNDWRIKTSNYLMFHYPLADLLTNHFFLFSTAKQKFCGQRFSLFQHVEDFQNHFSKMSG